MDEMNVKHRYAYFEILLMQWHVELLEYAASG